MKGKHVTTIDPMTAWQARMQLRRAAADLMAAMQGDLTTLALTESQFNVNRETPVTQRLEGRVLALLALFDPTLLDLNPEYVSTAEQHDFPTP
jgi:hypothetical protein